MHATLSRWGNSNAIRIPTSVCEDLKLTPGAVAEVLPDLKNKTVTFRFSDTQAPTYSRHRRMTMEEFAGNWTGGKTGEEWGGKDVDAEVVE